MRAWYTDLDMLGVAGEHLIDETTSLEDAVTAVLHHSGLAQAAALTPCPQTCQRCAQKRTQCASGPAGYVVPDAPDQRTQ